MNDQSLTERQHRLYSQTRVSLWLLYSIPVLLLLGYSGITIIQFSSSSYNSTLDLRLCLYTLVATSLVAFITGEVTGNVSQIDKLWSLLPAVYTWEMALTAPCGRLYLMAGLVTVWSARLTYNFTRRGGYGWPPWRGEEDYRWEYVRKWPILNTRIGWLLFNLFFISVYQNILLLLISCPGALTSQHPPLNCLDVCLAVSFIALVFIETLADQQQYEFQTVKWDMIKSRQPLPFPYSLGFPTEGLFSISRHPNYLCEISLWFVFYGFSVSSGASLLNWSLTGAVLLALLFQGSTLLAESITASKYPVYKKYQARVDRFVGLWNPVRTTFPSDLD